MSEFIGRMSSFEQQFAAARKRYEGRSGTFDGVVLRPSHPKTEIPVVVAPGWGEGKDILKHSMKVLFEAGRPVIGIDHPRRGGVVKPNESQQPLDEIRKAQTIHEILNQENIPQVDIVGHSEAAIYAALAATDEKMRNMVLFNPAGLIGEDTIPGLLGRFVAKNVDNTVRTAWYPDTLPRALSGQAAAAKYFSQNPARAISEIRAISQIRIEDMLKKLHDKGVGIVIVHGASDAGFPMDRMQQIVKSSNNPAGFVDGFLSVRGGHDELYIRPQQYATAAEEMLTALEQKRAR